MNDEGEEDHDGEADAWVEPGDHYWRGRNAWSSWSRSWHDNHWDWYEGTSTEAPSSRQSKYDVSEAASQEADKFLPDFVVAWMLLQRSGLDSTERGAIIANLKNQFTTEHVKSALRIAWPDDDLKKRDHQRGSVLLVDDDEEAFFHDDDQGDLHEWEPPEEDQAEYSYLSSEVESALQAYQGARRTLKEAREKQSLFRKSRQFFPGKRETTTRFKTEVTSVKRCFKCGGNHSTHECPQKSGGSHGQQSAHLAFQVYGSCSEPKRSATTSTQELGLSLSQILAEGKAIIDGGATSSVGSSEALDQILNLQAANAWTPQVEVEVQNQPNFRFGNGGQKQCLSTAKLAVPLGETSGTMNIHVHDIDGQPVLLSISALRTLGAVIDFQSDEMILKSVDPRQVIKLETTPGGHQVFPLTTDILSGSFARSEPFLSLRDAGTE